jgi:Pyruvate/2-oxoacid:ferredoxin oxidoreductase delta subunit
MDRLFARLRTRLSSRAIAATTFCEGCGGVCTPTCRQDALREQAQLRAQELSLYRH